MATRDHFGRLTRFPGEKPPYHDPAPHNCLTGICCPNPGCRGSRQFSISGHDWTDDGCDSARTFTAADRCGCADCGHQGTVAQFGAGERPVC